MYTFQTKYPEPFNQEWKTSGRRFETLELCLKAISDWLYACAINDTYVSVRILLVQDV